MAIGTAAQGTAQGGQGSSRGSRVGARSGVEVAPNRKAHTPERHRSISAVALPLSFNRDPPQRLAGGRAAAVARRAGGPTVAPMLTPDSHGCLPECGEYARSRPRDSASALPACVKSRSGTKVSKSSAVASSASASGPHPTSMWTYRE